MRSMRVQTCSLLLACFVASPSMAQVVINEVYPDPGSNFDGSEFIEVRNKGGASVNIGNWALTGTEFAGTCGGERHWQFPAGTTIAANGYIVVAKDSRDSASQENDGFVQRFGFDPNFEMYDADQSFEFDDPAVTNLILLNNEAGQDSEIRLVPGNGYSKACSAIFNRYEALYLYNGVPGGGGTVVDVIEYRHPDCVGDACLGVGSGDNDAFVGFPSVGESLGRSSTAGDTNNSSVDLSLGSASPGAANIANPGPLLSNLLLNNPDPKVGESVTVTITATDTNGIGSLYVVRIVNAGAPDSTLMSLSGPNTYTGTIPSQANGAKVDYFVRARDAGSPAGVGVSKYPDFSVRKLRWGTQTINSVQFFSPPSDTGQSSEVGNAVNIEGVVTAEPGLYNAGTFVIQSAAGFFNGVHCFDNTGTTVVQRGDSVRVAGVVQEYFDMTEVTFFGPTNVTVLATGRPLPGPQSITDSQITTGAPAGETLEGVYARLVNQKVTLANDGFGQFEVTDATGTGLIGDDSFYNYVPTLGDSLNSVSGIVFYSFAERKLEPRDDGDIVGPPIVSNVRYSPVPPTAASALTITCTITDNGTIPRAKLYYSTNNGATYDSTNLVNTSGTTWSVAIGPYPNLTEVDYHVEVTDNQNFKGRAPIAGDYDVAIGLRTIEQVQSTLIAGSDSSQFEGKPVNVSGIVTAAPGMFGENILYLQNHWTVDPAYRGIAVFTGGSLVGQVQLGDSVTVGGDVDEYFGYTEIRMHFTESFHNYGQVGEIQGFELDTNDLPSDSTGVVPTSEPWEGVLVMCKNSVVTNASAGFGEWNIDNTAPRTGLEALVDDFAPYAYVPSLGDSVSVRGVVEFAFGTYKIQPRNDADILPYNPANAVGVGEIATADLRFALHPNTPNPFGSGTKIAFSVPVRGDAKLRVFDVQGRLVRTLVNGPVDAGRHVVDWNGTNDTAQPVSSGVYFYRLEAEGKEATRKMIHLK